jgi:hypothetical protein
MIWEDIRQQYPDRWVIVEALNAFTQDGQRIIPELRLVNAFGSDWREAWESYKQIHHADKNREYYPLHTKRKVLEIGVIDAFGHILG